MKKGIGNLKNTVLVMFVKMVGARQPVISFSNVQITYKTMPGNVSNDSMMLTTQIPIFTLIA